MEHDAEPTAKHVWRTHRPKLESVEHAAAQHQGTTTPSA